MGQAQLYQSVLRHISLLPVQHLLQVEQYLSDLNRQSFDKHINRLAILALAGSWKDLSEADFEEILTIGRESVSSLFAREIDL